MWYRNAFVILFLVCTSPGIAQVTEKALELTFADQCPDAMRLLETELQEEEQKNTKDLLYQADLQYTLAVVEYMCGEGEAVYKSVLEHHQKALDIRLAQLPPGDPKTIKSYFGLGILHQNFGRFPQSIKAGLEAARLLEGAVEKDSLMLAKTYVLLGVVYEETGDLSNALNFSQQALALSLALGEQYRAVVCLNNIGLIHLAYEDYPQAIQAFQHIENMEAVSLENLANAYNNLGLAYVAQEKVDSAIRYFNLAKKINERLYIAEQYPEDRLKLADNLENLGIAYKKKGAYDIAAQQIKASLQILSEELQTQHHPTIGACFDNMGDIFFEQGDFVQAIAHYQKGIASLVPGLPADQIKRLPDFRKDLSLDNYTLFTLLRGKAQCFYRLYQQQSNQRTALYSAYQGYENLDTLITQIRQLYRRGDSRYALISKTHSLYEEALEVALERYRLTGEERFLERAFQYAAQNKAIVLLEGLQAEKARYAHVPANLLEAEVAIRKKCIDLENQIYDFQLQGLDLAADSLKQTLFQQRRSYDKLIQQLEKQYPNYYHQKYTFLQAPKASDLQQKLPANGRLLEFFIGDRSIHLFVLSNQTLQHYATPKPQNFERLCDSFQDLSTQDRISNTKSYRSIAYQLYQLLLKEALANTANQKVNRLFVVPDGPLHQISFDNLFYEKTTAWKNRNNPYLIKKFALSYAYSSRLFFDTSAKNRIEKASKNFAGFGLAYDEYTLKSLSEWYQHTAKQSRQKRSLGKLLYAKEEIQTISKLFDGDTWVDKAATLDAFLQFADQYQVLHLAMHALEIKDQPLHSALAFSRSSDSSHFLIRASELYTLPLKADMVVLSACDTGAGPWTKGEGVRSLARAFAFAGCPSIIASLWSASDASSKEILIPFYQHLQEGLPKDIALQKAKLQYLEQSAPSYVAPSYWSNLALVGTADAIDFNTSSNYVWWLMLALFLGLALLWKINSRSKH